MATSKKLQAILETDFYHTPKKERPDIYAIRRQLAKAANQRMVRLEQNISPITGKSYAFGAYDIAQDYLEKEGRPLTAKGRRFQESINAAKDESEILAEIAVLQQFLTYKTSSYAAQKAIEKSRVETFGSVISPELAASKEFYEFLSSETFENLSTKGFTSSQIIDYFDRVFNEGTPIEKIVESFNEYKDSEIRRSHKSLQNALGLSN